MGAFPPVTQCFRDLREAIINWCEGRFWPGRALLLVWFAYIGLHHLIDPEYFSLFGGLNLAIHEGGHKLFQWSGDYFLTVAGGTILQLAAPVMSAIMFIRQPDYFAVGVCGVWLGTNLYGVARYVGDAREMILPLVTVGHGDCEYPCHDWHYMLENIGSGELLFWDTTIAKWLRIAGFLWIWGSIVGGVWMLWLMAQSKKFIEDN